MIVARFGEIGLKSKPVKRRLVKILVRNIYLQLGSSVKSVKEGENRIIIEEKDKKALKKLENVFGITSFSPTISSPSEMKKIASAAIGLFDPSAESFAIRVNRSWKQFPKTSMQMENIIGKKIVEKFKKKVDLESPEKTIYIDIRRNETYIYSEIIKGQGGLPVGASGKIVSVIKNKSDILATYLMMKRGCLPIIVSSINIKPIEKYFPGKIRSYTIQENKLFKKAEEISKDEKIDFVVTGETEIRKTKSPASPLIGFTLREIEEKLREI